MHGFTEGNEGNEAEKGAESKGRDRREQRGEWRELVQAAGHAENPLIRFRAGDVLRAVAPERAKTRGDRQTQLNFRSAEKIGWFD